MLWLLGAFWGLSALELFATSDGRGWHVVAPFVLLTLIFGGLAGAARLARKEGVGLMVWLETLPAWIPQSALLAGVTLATTAVVIRLGMGREEIGDAAIFGGMGIAALATVCGVRPLIGGRRTWKIGARKREEPAGGSDS